MTLLWLLQKIVEYEPNIFDNIEKQIEKPLYYIFVWIYQKDGHCHVKIIMGYNRGDVEEGVLVNVQNKDTVLRYTKFMYSSINKPKIYNTKDYILGFETSPVKTGYKDINYGQVEFNERMIGLYRYCLQCFDSNSIQNYWETYFCSDNDYNEWFERNKNK